MKRPLFFVLFSLTFLSACQSGETDVKPEEQASTLLLTFENVVGNLPLVLNEVTYSNPVGEAFTVSKFNYYLSNIRLKKADGSEYLVPESYFLLQHLDALADTLVLNEVPAGEYTGVSFVLGVDSARNCSGAQTGALDPANGMFWNWNTGYIFLKLEGSSPQSGNANGNFLYHVGGYKGATNAIRTITPDLREQTFTVRTGKRPELHFRVNVLEILKTPEDISFATTYVVHTPADGVKLANNYQDMFRFDHLHP